MTRMISLWEGERLTLERAMALTGKSLQRYGSLYRHWAIAYICSKVLADGVVQPLLQGVGQR